MPPLRPALLAACLILLAAACDPPVEQDASPAQDATIGTHDVEGEGAPAPRPTGVRSPVRDSEWFDAAAFDEQLARRAAAVEGPDGEPWAQSVVAPPADAAPFAKPRPHHLCFSNAGLDSPWAAVGFTTMQAEVDLHDDAIASFTAVDAGGDEEAQLADIQALVTGGECDLLIVAPVSDALTPAVAQACEQLPVVVFERPVPTDCPVTRVGGVGSYAFGADGAEFLLREVPEGGTVLAVRTHAGRELHERRLAAARVIMEEAGVTVEVTEPSGGDGARAAELVTARIAEGPVDGIWMDAGTTAAAVVDAFEAAGVPVPPISGEDQLDFLARWQARGLTAAAPTYPAHQWRTPIIAALRILDGEPVPSPWTVPQPVVGAAQLDQLVRDDLPATHYALCGCESLPGYPDRWR